MAESSSSASARTPIAVSNRMGTFIHAQLFVLGFSAMFVIVWGGAATLIGQAMYNVRPVLSKIGGIVVILFGLITLGVVRIPLLFRDTRPQWSNRPVALGSSVLPGVFFAAGWTPCIGTTLGAILTLGMSGQTSGQAMLLSTGY
jgi:cytochrome c-type biogenesis protein